MTSDNIWPERFVSLPSGNSMYGADWLSDEQTETVRAIVSEGRNSALPSPVILDGSTVRLIELVPLGEDGIGRGQILIRVTNERPYQNVHLRLAAVPYPTSKTPDDELELITPDVAGAILDEIVAKIKAVPDLALLDYED